MSVFFSNRAFTSTEPKTKSQDIIFFLYLIPTSVLELVYLLKYRALEQCVVAWCKGVRYLGYQAE